MWSNFPGPVNPLARSGDRTLCWSDTASLLSTKTVLQEQDHWLGHVRLDHHSCFVLSTFSGTL